MPRVYFTGRKKLAQERIRLELRPGRPPQFDAQIDLQRHRLPPDAKVVVEAYHNTLLQRFDFGTVADCRPRDATKLTSFDEWDRPQFRVRVVDTGQDPGRILASCERVHRIDPEDGGERGRSLLKLFPRPDDEMDGELWRVESSGGGYQLAYNKDAPGLERDIKSKRAATLGLILPAAMREILAREMLWEGVGADESSEWVALAQSFCGEPAPVAQSDGLTKDDVASWIDRAVQAFCQDRGRFLERMAEMEKPG
ncbi:MAG: hypothetical protein H6509_15185 [Bryobacterales bacterium]|nr:hypothetical protein [Bryobacterales bacterium]